MDGSWWVGAFTEISYYWSWKNDAHDFAIDKVSIVAVNAAEGVAAISLYLCLGSIVDAKVGCGGGGDLPVRIDVTAIICNFILIQTLYIVYQHHHHHH